MLASKTQLILFWILNMIIEKAKLQPITDASWIVYSSSDKLGILNKDTQDHYTFIDGRVLLKFNDENEVVEHFGNTHLFQNQITTEVVQPNSAYIRGYKTKVPNPVFIESDHELYDPNLPLYLKKANSKAPFAAGYYCIQFPNLGWVKTGNLAARTLYNYPYAGPFRTEAESKTKLAELKGTKNVRNKQPKKNAGIIKES